MNRYSCYVRITHIPSQIKVEIQDDYHRPCRAKQKAMNKLRSMLYAQQIGITPSEEIVANYDFGEEVYCDDAIKVRDKPPEE